MKMPYANWFPGLYLPDARRLTNPDLNELRSSLAGGQRLAFAGRREMKIDVIKQDVHRNGVVHEDRDFCGACGDFDSLAGCRNLQILHGLKNRVLYFVFGVMVYDR